MPTTEMLVSGAENGTSRKSSEQESKSMAEHEFTGAGVGEREGVAKICFNVERQNGHSRSAHMLWSQHEPINNVSFARSRTKAQLHKSLPMTTNLYVLCKHTQIFNYNININISTLVCNRLVTSLRCLQCSSWWHEKNQNQANKC